MNDVYFSRKQVNTFTEELTLIDYLRYAISSRGICNKDDHPTSNTVRIIGTISERLAFRLLELRYEFTNVFQLTP
jgi:hypothetical protein